MGLENFDIETASERLRKRLEIFYDAAEMLAAISPREAARQLRDDAEQYVLANAYAAMSDARNFEPACGTVEDATLQIYAALEERRETIARELEKAPRTAH